MAGGGNNVARMSPRQRMINLMYIVLTAMLALNVSSDVLNGFNQVHDGIQQTNANISSRNNVQFEHLQSLYEQNPEKTEKWYKAGLELHNRSEEMFSVIENLKAEIASAADGKDGDYRNLVNNDDLEASSVTMLNPATGKGANLRKLLNSYSDYVSSLISDSTKKASVREMRST